MPGPRVRPWTSTSAVSSKRRRPARARYASRPSADTGPAASGRLVPPGDRGDDRRRDHPGTLGRPRRLLVSRRDQFRGRPACSLATPPGDSSAAGRRRMAWRPGRTCSSASVSLRRLAPRPGAIRREPAQTVTGHESAYVLRDAPGPRPCLPEGRAGHRPGPHRRRITPARREDAYTAGHRGPGRPAIVAFGRMRGVRHAGHRHTALPDFTNSRPDRPAACTASFLDCLAAPTRSPTSATFPARLVCTAPWTNCRRHRARPAAWGTGLGSPLPAACPPCWRTTTASERQRGAASPRRQRRRPRTDRRASQREVPSVTAAPPLPGVRGDRAWHIPLPPPLRLPNRLPYGTSAANLSRTATRLDCSPLSRRRMKPARQSTGTCSRSRCAPSSSAARLALVNLPPPDTLLERAATCRARHPAKPPPSPPTAEQLAATLHGSPTVASPVCPDVAAAAIAMCRARCPPPGAAPPRADRERGHVPVGDGPHRRPPTAFPMPPWGGRGLRPSTVPPDEGRSEKGNRPPRPPAVIRRCWPGRCCSRDFAARHPACASPSTSGSVPHRRPSQHLPGRRVPARPSLLTSTREPGTPPAAARLDGQVPRLRRRLLSRGEDRR